MLREFQDEIARLKAQLAERQQQGGGGGGGGGGGSGSQGGSPDKAAAALGAAAGSGSSSAAVDARAAAIRKAMRAELEQQLRQAVTLEALAKARQAIEQQARWGGMRSPALPPGNIGVHQSRHSAATCPMPAIPEFTSLHTGPS